MEWLIYSRIGWKWYIILDIGIGKGFGLGLGVWFRVGWWIIVIWKCYKILGEGIRAIS